MKKNIKIPRVVRIEPTSICNFRCKHCTTGLRINKSIGTMDRKSFDMIFDKIKNIHFNVAVLYHGGEPLLNKDLFYFVEKMKLISNFVKFVTNGSLLNDSNINKILKSGLDLIEFSFDGHSAEENDLIRQGSNFNTISFKIKKLINAKKKQILN